MKALIFPALLALINTTAWYLNAMNAAENPQKPPIPPYYVLAIKLRYQGRSSTQIAQAIRRVFGLAYSPETIRWWFKAGGPARAEYDQYAQAQNEMLLSQVNNIFVAKLYQAQKVLLKAMEGEAKMIQVIAAKEWLDRALGKPIVKATADANITMTLADLMASVSELGP